MFNKRISIQGVHRDAVDSSAVSATSAFAKFAEKGLKQEGIYVEIIFMIHLLMPINFADFSESLVKRRRRKGKGFLPEQTEFEIQDEASVAKEETPLQRFHRLQAEVKQLHEELAAAAKVSR